MRGGCRQLPGHQGWIPKVPRLSASGVGCFITEIHGLQRQLPWCAEVNFAAEQHQSKIPAVGGCRLELGPSNRMIFRSHHVSPMALWPLGDLTVVDELALASKAPQPELGYFGWYPWLGNSKFSYILKHHNRSPSRLYIYIYILYIYI